MKKTQPLLKNFNHMVFGGDYNPDQWLEMPEILKEDDRLMKLAHINSVTVGVFSWKALEPDEDIYNFGWLDKTMDRMAANGIKVILATPTGARPAWMDKNHPEVLRMNADRVRNLHGGRHNHCYTSPYYRKKSFQMDQMLAARYRNHPALGMWHISNEFGGECHCPLCQEAFRDFLRTKYHNDINELNDQWWTGFWSKHFSRFDEIESPAPHGEQAIHGLYLDWMRFVTYQTRNFMENEIAAVRAITPDTPVTTNYMGPFAGLNYQEIGRGVDVISWDAYPYWHNDKETVAVTAANTGFYHDMYRSMKGKPFLLMESTPSIVNWQQYNKLQRPGMNILTSMQAVAHGADSVQYFQWRKGRGAAEKFHGAIVDHDGSEHTRVFKECEKLGAVLTRCDCVRGTGKDAKAAIIYDFENDWAIGNMNGLSVNKEYEPTCKLHYRALWNCSISLDVIDMTYSLDSYKLVIAPMLYMLRNRIVDKFRKFVENGGTLVTTYATGYVNENDLCWLGGFPGNGMKELCGVWAEEIDSLYPEDKNSINFTKGVLSGKSYQAYDYCELIHPLEGTEVLAVYGNDFYKDTAAVTRHSYGKGAVYYIAARMDEDAMEEIYGAIAKEAGITCCMEELSELPKGVNIQKREGDGEEYYFLLNYTAEEKTVAFKNTVHLENLMDGSNISGDSVVLKSYEVMVLKG